MLVSAWLRQKEEDDDPHAETGESRSRQARDRERGPRHITRRRAFNLLTSNEIRSCFDLDQEDNRLRERYGKTLFGNCSLIAHAML